MKSFLLSIVAGLLIFHSGSHDLFAQFTVKIPKVPKIDKTKNDPPNTDNGNSNRIIRDPQRANDSQSKDKANSKSHIYTNIKPTNKPVFVKDTLYIQAHTREEYWKFPTQRDYSSWVPNTKFDVFYDNRGTLNYVAEYTNPDGSPWYSEKLDQGPLAEDNTVRLESPRPNQDEVELKRSTVGVGTYGIKIINKETGEVAFQGKFKVGKFRAFDDPRDKNRFEFYVDHDWLMPIAYVGFETSGSLEISALMPSVAVWLKGNVQTSELEAKLFYKGQQIATTANGGGAVVDQGERSTLSSARFADQYLWKQWHFRWKTFLFDNGNQYIPGNYPGALYADKNPGEYTVEVFRNGAQIREMKFTIGADGKFADAGFANPIFLLNYNVIIPVKVMATTEKWNPAAWKIDAFYGNPMNGFVVQ